MERKSGGVGTSVGIRLGTEGLSCASFSWDGAISSRALSSYSWPSIVSRSSRLSWSMAMSSDTCRVWPSVRSSARRGDGVDARVSSGVVGGARRSEEHTSELQSRGHLVCRLLLEKKNDH